jgi:hypothetical protein
VSDRPAIARLKGHVALVAGGIGRALVLVLSAEGVAVLQNPARTDQIFRSTEAYTSGTSWRRKEPSEELVSMNALRAKIVKDQQCSQRPVSGNTPSPAPAAAKSRPIFALGRSYTLAVARRPACALI